MRARTHHNILVPCSVREYSFSVTFTRPALTSSLSPLLTLNIGCPVCSETAFAVDAPFLIAVSVTSPLFVGFPSAETHGKTITTF